MRVEKVNEDVTLGCEVWSRGSRAWGHKAKVFYKGYEVDSASVRYYNRTWEMFQFDTVKSCLMNKLDKSKALPLSDRIAIARFIKRITN